MQKETFEIEIGGKKISAEFNNLADQTNGSVLMRMGETAVLVTAVMGKNEKDGDFFPLTVDFEEKFYASGRIGGNRFQRREGRPSEEAILSGRIIDRTIRPLFDQYIRNEIQVVVTTLAIGEEQPDFLGLLGSSLALASSDIPWNGPVAGLRIGQLGEDFIINPQIGFEEADNFISESFICGKDGNVNMIEIGAKEISEETANKILATAVTEIEKLNAWQKEIVAKIGKAKIKIDKLVLDEKILGIFNSVIAPQLSGAVFTGQAGKDGIHHLEEELVEKIKGIVGLEEKHLGKQIALAKSFYEDRVDAELHRGAIEDNRRADNRGFEEVRTLFAQAGGISAATHGTGIFFRGGTHVLSTLTLGGPRDAMTVEEMGDEEEEKRFIHHYNFPPFSSGEVGRIGGVNRRAVGHGNLAEKALKYVIPAKEIFPYTIRLVSESLASNGSTSQASVCAGCLALMDGGVPITKAVAGIASGLLMRDENNYKLLTDIQGPEDHFGDMDFKVAGTKDGITAVQMDIKVDGIPLKILAEAFVAAQKARFQILDKMLEAIPVPRAKIAPSAPKIITMTIKEEQIGAVIGKEGKVIKNITEVSGAEIVIEDDGSVFITGKEGKAEKAKEMIEAIVKEWKVGDTAVAKVVKILEGIGAVAQFGMTDGLIHISEIASFRIEKIADYLQIGQEVPVVIKEVREDNGRQKIGLSIKRIKADFIKAKNNLTDK